MLREIRAMLPPLMPPRRFSARPASVTRASLSPRRRTPLPVDWRLSKAQGASPPLLLSLSHTLPRCQLFEVFVRLLPARITLRPPSPSDTSHASPPSHAPRALLSAAQALRQWMGRVLGGEPLVAPAEDPPPPPPLASPPPSPHGSPQLASPRPKALIPALQLARLPVETLQGFTALLLPILLRRRDARVRAAPPRRCEMCVTQGGGRELGA